MTREFETLDHLAVPAFVLDVGEDGRPVYVAFNRVARQAAGFSRSDYLNKTATQLYGEPHGAIAYARHRDVIAQGQGETYELDLPLGGEIRQIRTTLEPVLNAHGDVVRLVGTSQDISQTRRAVEAQVSLETITGEMEQFVAMAAHDLRAPMRNIVSLVEMIREDFEDRGDGKVELIDMLAEVAGNSMKLIADILAHVQATGAKMSVSRFRLDALCKDIAGILDPAGRHAFQFDPAEIEADRNAIQIVLRNLMDNALKHGGRDRLAIGVDVEPLGEGFLKFSVSDDGKGFDETERIFNDDGRMRVETGYGLFGIFRLIRARGGRIEAKNRSGRGGARVRFSLPGAIVGTHSDSAAIPPAPVPEVLSRPKSGTGGITGR